MRSPRSSAKSLLILAVINGAFVSTMVGCAACDVRDRDVPTIINATRDNLRITLANAGESWNIPVYHAGDTNGPRVIFVHGTPGHAREWRQFLSEPMKGFEYVAIDRPGFGESTPRRVAPSLADQAQVVEALLEPRCGMKPILVGHSLGGPIVARVAAEQPDRVGALVIISGALDPSLERVNPLQYVGAMFPISSLLPRNLREANRELMPLKGQLTELEGMLDRITCPVVIMHATNDGLVPYANVAYMVDHLVNARSVEVMTLQDGNHFLPWKKKPDVDVAIKRAVTLARSGEALANADRAPAGGRVSAASPSNK